MSNASNVYVILGLSNERSYADAAKEVLARKAAPHALDGLLTGKGVLFGGQVTSLVGAFGSHEYMLKAP